MEFKVVEESKNKIVADLVGESHTLANALRKELWNDSHVKVSGYHIEHPLKNIPRLVVETDGKESPRDALVEASKRLKKDLDKVKKAFTKDLK